MEVSGVKIDAYLEVQDSVTTYNLWCVLSTSMTFPCAMKTVQQWPDPRAGDAIHPVLGKGVVWFTRLSQSHGDRTYHAEIIDIPVHAARAAR